MSKIINHLFSEDKRQHRQVRSKIVLTSPELVSIKPANEIDVGDVTEQAQVSRSTFYKCFRSVDDLLNVSAKQAALELMPPIVSTASTILEVPTRLATKTRIAIGLFTSMPLLGKLMLKTEWPFRDAQHKGYKDVQKDVAQGIEQGCFTDMPLEIAVNLVLSFLRGAVRDKLDSPQPQDYEDQVIYHLLLSLGVDSEAAEKISKIPLDQLPDLPKKGLVGKILTLVS